MSGIFGKLIMQLLMNKMGSKGNKQQDNGNIMQSTLNNQGDYQTQDFNIPRSQDWYGDYMKKYGGYR